MHSTIATKRKIKTKWCFNSGLHLRLLQRFCKQNTRQGRTEILLFSLQIKTRVSRKTKWSEKSQSIICHWKTSLDQAGIWHVELLAVEGSFRQTVRSFNSPPLYTHSTYITWHCATAVICLVMSCPPETTSQCPRSGPTGDSSHWPELLFSHLFPLTDCVTEDVFNFIHTAPIVSWDLVIWHLATQIRFIGPTLSPQPDRVWVCAADTRR